ncbi:Desosaminyl transferase EryCIII precursor [Micromonospora sp. MW-13]|uniref:glycosyltransferase n=1 Tax=Micromonospora sp. MW-13 TaxID=2094022 RepID=UPI000E42E85D|nr:glycosyltransferase [Micromonospora sp. MW-13]RGC69598.1 Desosaminyl transferase EryCIII precursor [Micromonospora sp. MW-13]
MRVAFTSHPNPSHLVGVLSAARVARLAGHEVAVVSGPSVVDHVEQAGFTALPVASLMSMEEMVAARAAAGGAVAPTARPGPPPAGGPPGRRAHPFITPRTSRQAADIVDALRAWGPDCVLRDSTELGGYVAAEVVDVPCGTVDIAPLSPCAQPGALEELNRLRAEFDLPAVHDPWHSVRPFRIGLVPEIFYPEELRWSGAHHYRPSSLDVRADRELAVDLSEHPGDRPLVLASLGMNAPRFDPRAATVLNAVIEALGELPVTGVVAIGSDYDPDQWEGARAANVHLRSFVPQRALLRFCDLFITHAGFNGVREAFSEGVPMIALPLFGDHPASAARLASLGVAVELDVASVSAAAVRTAVSTVLGDPGYRGRAQDMRCRMDALPPLDRMADDLLAFVTSSGRPARVGPSIVSRRVREGLS